MSENCRSCHAEVYAAWEPSHHATANRTLDDRDFSILARAPDMREGVLQYRLQPAGRSPTIKIMEGEEAEIHPLDGVIGVDPLHQYLARFDGGRWQTTSVAWDPAEEEWFNVFGDDNRQPWEWGHWSGQGHNWNANCAWCHMTDYEKNYDALENVYHSTWQEQAIGCIQCHPGMKEHVSAVEAGGSPTVPELSARLTMENCASCHSRREQLTKDQFHPGERFADHFRLALPDTPGVYYADGQVRDENFVWGSFHMSTMHDAGVRCADCHDPHSAELILPARDNSLCQRCHSTGHLEATIIDPVAHSRHPMGSTGNQCVECHMPHTTYMARDPRRDHGFHSPDPRLTIDFGIPNACNRCHGDQTPEWAAEWTEKWYGEDYLAEENRRTRAVQAAYERQGDAAELIALARQEENAIWRATLTSLLSVYLREPGVPAFLRERLADKAPRVRDAAVNALAALPAAQPYIAELADDPYRNVRLQVAAALRQQLPPSLEAEWQEYLEMNADRPMALFLLAEQAIQRGDPARAEGFLDRAISFDHRNPHLRQQAAVLLSQAGNIERAWTVLEEAREFSPNDPFVNYSLGLLAAEKEELNDAVRYLQLTVQADPEFFRAWYNLALAYTHLDQRGNARKALAQAEKLSPGSPEVRQLRRILRE